MENNNGRGIFYGVIGVATLVVAIIGATFAYFSASVSATGNLTAGTANIKLGYTEVTDGIRDKIIPVDTDAADATGDDVYDNASAFAGVIGVKPLTDSKPSCLDTVGNQVCSVYQFTIKNESPSAQKVYGYFNQTTEQTDITDMYYAMFVGTPASWDVHGEAKEAETQLATTDKGGLIVAATKVNDGMKAGNPAEDAEGGVANNWSSIDTSDVFLQANGTVTYTVVLWIEESYAEQKFTNKTFNANIRFDTGSGTGVTGNLGTTAVSRNP